MTTIDLFFAVTFANLVSVFIAGGVNYSLDKYYAKKRRAKLDDLLATITHPSDIREDLPIKTVKKTVKKAAQKKNG